ncbi:RluA family pseudouridine synthase [Gudongella sp. SC589]|jgi:23S rRNA pseudouridine1911/1915/1917 synthase|uniref:RluA family pseudouridine synthase n=1 Tax=Gudongella sp. SC589 TaxID=3385990 RepID=UPI003904D6F2
MDIKVIWEDEDIIVVEKPPGMPCQRDKTGDLDLMAELDRDYLGLVHRLDRPVGGIMVYAKNEASNTWLSNAIRERTFHKEYLAVVCGVPDDKSGQIVDYLKKLRTVNMSKVVTEDVNGSKRAILDYELLQTVNNEDLGTLSLLHVILKTGRHHQIRVQLSNAGFPLWGDTKYNREFTKIKEWTKIALWSHRIKFRHPGGRKVSFYSSPGDIHPWNLFQMPEYK